MKLCSTPTPRLPPASYRGRRADAAFSLIEVAMTAFILALAIVTSITTMQRAFANLDTARNISTASAILQTEMEKERLFTWTKVSDVTYQPTIDASILRNPTVAGRFTLSRSVTQVIGPPDQTTTPATPGTARSGQVQVTLTVRWRNYDGRTLARSFTTYFTQGGLNEFLYTKS